jgi:diguanylate cyclase (GGDEF)-like protein
MPEQISSPNLSQNGEPSEVIKIIPASELASTSLLEVQEVLPNTANALKETLSRAWDPTGDPSMRPVLAVGANALKDSLRIQTTQQSLLAEIAEKAATTERIATIDALTGLYNKAHFSTELRIAIREAARNNNPVTVMMLDLNRFKPINDTHGHKAGDQVLAEIAKRLRASVRAYDPIGRLGGDEFGLIIGGITPEEAEQKKLTIKTQVEQQMYLPNLPGLGVGTAVGINYLTQNEVKNIDGQLDIIEKMKKEAEDTGNETIAKYSEALLDQILSTLLDKADEAMYQDKESSGQER